jgi:hypothetical protein
MCGGKGACVFWLGAQRKSYAAFLIVLKQKLYKIVSNAINGNIKVFLEASHRQQPLKKDAGVLFITDAAWAAYSPIANDPSGER